MNADVLVDGANGFARRASDAEGWVEAVRRLASDPALRARLGAAGRRTVEEGYSLERAAPRMAEVLRGGP
jgi:glycosyltransferase involved in cell wall biosynthesis